MSEVRGYITTRRKPLTVAERRATERAQALFDCRQGRHSATPTFRPGETVCLVCGRVAYCPECLDASHLPYPTATHAYPLTCLAHQPADAQRHTQVSHTPKGKDACS